MMGSVTNSILSGRTGHVVITNVHGVEVSCTRPVTCCSSTRPQTAHRHLFRFAVAFLVWYSSIACLFFGKRKGLVTPYTQAQANIMKSIQPGGGDVVINYNKVLISKGTRPEMIPCSMSAGADSFLAGQQHARQHIRTPAFTQFPGSSLAPGVTKHYSQSKPMRNRLQIILSKTPVVFINLGHPYSSSS